MAKKTATASEEPEKKQFSFKETEARILNSILQRNQASVIDFVSFLALERFAYQLTKNTQFEVAGDLKSIKIWEAPEQPEIKPETNSDTAKALKK